MSSRALRRLQREQEQKRQFESLEVEENAAEEEDSGSEKSIEPIPKTKRNVFNLLDDEEEKDDANDEDEGSDLEAEGENPTYDTPPSTQVKVNKKKKKKKKKAKKNKAEDDTRVSESKASEESELDEIDRALKELSMKGKSNVHEQDVDLENENTNVKWTLRTSKLLTAEAKNLNPITEMKTLFGSAALEVFPESRPRNQARTQGEGVDLGTALLGRYSPVSRGQELGSLAGRRNIFMHGKPEWPQATSGGLAMELKSDVKAAEKTYQIIHKSAYMTTQFNFQAAVEMMQPERMISLLQLNPYHISTLLQVSEIAKHQGDHSVSSDLLERALFTFGRSVHSTFSGALREGLARLEFDVSENRELWLTMWRYISSLGMRGTWRTAFEWAKVLLSLNPLKDPYSVTLFIDQLALRGRQQEQLIDLCADDAFGQTWSHLPNIQISLSLAYYRIKNSSKARRTLAAAIHKFPYIIARLFQELDLSPIPKSIWGSLPSNDAEKLYSELYVTRAKDLWNTPETTALLMEVAQSMGSYDMAGTPPPPKLEVSLEEARHVLLADIPALIALLPRRFTTMATSSSDPLPPPTSTAAAGFTSRAPGEAVFPSPTEAIRSAANAGAGWFSRLMEWFQGPGLALQGEELDDAFQRALAAEGDAVPAPILEALRNQQATEMSEDDEEIGLDPDAGVGSNPVRPASASATQNDREIALGLQDDIFTDRPLAATVEDELDEDSSNARPQVDDQPRPGHVIFSPTQSAAVSDDVQPSSSISEQNIPTKFTSILGDPQRAQRWLLSSGIEPLQPFLAKHGSNVLEWPSDARDASQEAIDRYYTAMTHLRTTQRQWIINVLSQRDKELANLARNIMEVGRSLG